MVTSELDYSVLKSFHAVMFLSDLIHSISWDNNSVIKYCSLQNFPFPLNCLVLGLGTP